MTVVLPAPVANLSAVRNSSGLASQLTSVSRFSTSRATAPERRATSAQLRTMQRRVKEWRGIMAQDLVYASSNAGSAAPGGLLVLALAGADSKC